MRILRNLAGVSLMLAALVGAATHASAAESFDSCSGFVDAVPATITTQGTWCLRHNLSTNANGIHAIDIQADSVTIDCNGFKIGNVPAGIDTTSTGIFADSRANIKVRHCSIVGFHDGINIDSTNVQNGHLIEDNVLSQNRVNGIVVMGGGVIVQRNRVVNTGGNSTSLQSFGIQTSGDVLDNVVDTIVAASGVSNFNSVGIQTSGNGSLVQGNRVRNLVQKGISPAIGISIASGTANEMRDNYVVQGTSTSGIAISCNSEGGARNNVMKNYTTGLGNCDDDGGNVGP
jgi:hypothetical protein